MAFFQPNVGFFLIDRRAEGQFIFCITKFKIFKTQHRVKQKFTLFLILLLDEGQDRKYEKDFLYIEGLMNDLLEDVNRTILFQGKYKKAERGHHQYALFDLRDILPEFCMGKKITGCFNVLIF